VATWGVFAAADPALAEAGRRLVYQFGPGLGFLATLRPDGAPRLHPFCPLITADGLFGFLIDSPKQRDLRRDPRYAFHTFPPEAVDDEFTVAGRVREVTDAGIRAQVEERFRAEVREDDPALGSSTLFELQIERAMLAVYTHRGAWPPTYSIWRAPSADGAP
jgi:Pyridoxamine 5'-phosphate oxidase